jgi:uncharacterized protein (TIGR00290 family)
MRQGYDISYLLNFISEEYKRVSFHGTEAKLIQLQAEALGIPLLQKETTPDGYEQEFKEAVRGLIPNGIRGMIFGDIYLQEHKDWVERVCADLKISAIEPLWGEEPERILLDFIDAGFEAIIVSAKSELLGKEWIGQKIDKEFFKYVTENGIDVCGENGEYHTLVLNGPMFKKKIRIKRMKSIRRNGYWFLDTVEYSLEKFRKVFILTRI